MSKKDSAPTFSQFNNGKIILIKDKRRIAVHIKIK